MNKLINTKRKKHPKISKVKFFNALLVAFVLVCNTIFPQTLIPKIAKASDTKIQSIYYFPKNVLAITKSQQYNDLQWQNLGESLQIDLNPNASFSEFTESNSANLVWQTSQANFGKQEVFQSENKIVSNLQSDLSDDHLGLLPSDDDNKNSVIENLVSTYSTEIIVEEDGSFTSEDKALNLIDQIADGVAPDLPLENKESLINIVEEDDLFDLEEKLLNINNPDSDVVELESSLENKNGFEVTEPEENISVESTDPDEQEISDDNNAAQEKELAQTNTSLAIAPILEFSSFSIPVEKNIDVPDNKYLSTIVAQVSLAFSQHSTGRLTLEYLDPLGIWQSAPNIDQEKNGYLSFKLPNSIFDTLGTLSLRIAYSAEYETLPKDSVFLALDGIKIQVSYDVPINYELTDEEILDLQNRLLNPESFTQLDFSSKTVELGLPGDLANPITVGKNTSSFKTQLKMLMVGAKEGNMGQRIDNKITYTDAFTNTDILYEITDFGLKESIILKSNERPDRFRYLINFDEYDYKQISPSRIELYKKGFLGSPLYRLYTLSAPYMIDSDYNISEKLSFKLKNNLLTLVPDPEWLKSARYPVIVDPTIEISVLNVHSHPIAGQEWQVSFVTNGVSDLYIRPADQETIDDMNFSSLYCGVEDKTSLVQILSGDVLFYPNWSCDDVAQISHEILVTGKHHLIFEFGGEKISAYNSAVSWDGGAGTSNWNDALNWSNDLVPGVDDDVVIASNIFVNLNSATTVNSLTIGNVGGTANSVLNFNYDAYENGALTINNNLIVYTNASISHSTSTNTILGRINLEVGGDATILGSINANSRGYHATAGPGSPPSISGTTGTGASHGGFGSLGVGTPETLGNIYGSTTAPTYLGSGGGRAINGAGAASTGLWGGGAIIMNVVGTTTISGTITANGSNSEPVDLSWNPGSGSGGSVYIRTGGMSGSGTISANGGGSNPYVGGGGGRIAVYYENDSSTINMTANGGGYRVPNSIKRFAGAGTIYKKSSEQNYGQLIIGNNNLGTNVEYLVGLSPVPVEITNLDSFTVSNSARVYLSGSLNTTDFNILSNGIFDALEGHDLNHTNINWSGGTIIDSGGGVSVLDENQDLIVPASSRLVFNEASNLNQSLRSYNNLTVNGILTHGYNTHATTGTESLIKLNWTINGDLTINSGGSINVDAKGYPVGNGPGSPPTNSGTTGSGASYGGVGALGAGLPETAGSTYGSSTAPTDLGSGGGYTCSGGTPNDRVGLWGGGAIIMNITGTTTINGSISSNGSTEEVIDLCWNPGSGSGGSVYLITDNLQGTGSITANGAGSAAKRGGGGGRIAIYANNAVSNPTRTASGGITGNVLNNGTDGTILPTLYPSVTTDSISDNYTGTTATANSTITGIGYYSINNHGVVWATWNNPNFPDVNLIDKIISGTPYGSKNSVLVPNAFDSSTTTKWYSNAGTPYDLEYGFPYNVVVNKYLIVGSEIINESPRDWQFQAWDGADWINLQTITNQTTWGIRESRTYNLVNETPYEKYRILISANNGSTYTALTDIEFRSTNESFSQSGFINEIGSYSEPMSGLSPNTTYYVRAFLSTNNGIVYGDNVSFATGEENSAPSAPSSLGPNIYVANSWASSSAPTLNFTLSDPDLLEQVKYRIQIDNDSNYSSPVVDYTSGLLNQGANNFTVGQPESTGTYTIGSEGQTLSESTSYYWRVQAIDEVGATSSFTLANSGSIAFKLDLTKPIPGTVNFTSINPTSISLNTTGSSDSLSGILFNRYYNLTTGLIATSSGISWSNTGLTPNTLYNFKIDVVDGALNSSTTPESSKYTRANVPTGTSAEVVSPSEILISWDANLNPDGTEYYVENLTSEFNSGWITATSTTISGLSCGVSYSFHVKARNAENVETSYGTAVSPDASPCNSSPNTPTSLGYSSVTNGGWISDNTPSLTFSLSDSDVSDTLKYTIQVSTTSDYTNLLVNYVSALGTHGAKMFTVGQATGTGEYLAGFANQTLPDRSEGYYWRVMAADNSSATSSWASANSGNIAFKLETVQPTAGVLSLTSTSTDSVTLSYSGSTDADSGLRPAPYVFYNTTNWNNSGNTLATSWTNSGLSAGTYNFKIRITDNAGNYRDVVLAESVTIEGSGGGSEEGDPWTGSVTEGFSIYINQNDSITSTNNVTLQLTAQTGTTDMLLSNLADFSDASLESYTTTKSWDLCAGLGSCTSGIYNVYAKFYNNASSSGAVSDSINYQILNTLVPGDLAIVGIATSSISVTISGSADTTYGLSANPYTFYNRTNVENSATSSFSSWTNNGLAPNTQYYFYGVVSNNNGDFGSTQDISAYTLANIPINSSAVANSSVSITVSWQANNNPPGTEYYVSNLTAATNSGWVTATSNIFSNLTCGTTYSFNVKARNAQGTETATTSQISVATTECSADPSPSENSSGGGGVTSPISPSIPILDPLILCPGPANEAFTYCYYNNKDFTHLIATGTTAAINYDWGSGSPDPKVAANTFSIIWEGNFAFQKGLYRFIALADDGIKVYVDNQLVINSWKDQSVTRYNADVELSAGVHNIRVEYYENQGLAVAKLSWQKKVDTDIVCPAIGNNFFTACYFDDLNLRTPVFSNTTESINYNWGSGSPGSDVPANNFSARWQGNFDFDNGAYVFTATADDGVRLYIDNELVIDKWRDQSASAFSYTKSLTAGKHLIKLEYYERGGQASIKLGWRKAAPEISSCPDSGNGVFTYCYYNNKDFTSLVSTGTVPNINFDWGYGSPNINVEPETFSAIWRGNFEFESGTYQFNLVADDGIRLYIDGQRVLDAWKDQAATNYTLKRTLAEGRHNLMVEYYENSGRATAKMSWNKTFSDYQLPTAHLNFVGITATSVIATLKLDNSATGFALASKPFIYYNFSSGENSFETSDTSVLFKNLQPDSEYIFYARITYSNGESVNTPRATVRTLPLQNIVIEPNPPTSTVVLSPSPFPETSSSEIIATGTQSASFSITKDIESFVGGFITGTSYIGSVIIEFFNRSESFIADLAVKGSDIFINIATDSVVLATNLTEKTKQLFTENYLPAKSAVSISAVAIAPTILALQYSIASEGLLLNIFSMSDLWFYLVRLFYGLLAIFGLKAKRRHWGTVFDSKTKQPLDPVLVELIEANSGKKVEQAITDLSGRFGFLDRIGEYYISVKKTHYSFPSKEVTGKSDGIFDNLYHGEILKILAAKDVLTPNIPMDRQAFDWNQEDKKKLIKFHPRLERAVNILLQILFWAGFIWVILATLSNPSLYNLFFLGVYFLLIVLRKFIPHSKLWGKIINSSGASEGLYLELSPKLIPSVILGKAVTSKNGKFFLKAPPGEYVLRIKEIQKENAKTIYQQEIKVGKQGVVNKNITI